MPRFTSLLLSVLLLSGAATAAPRALEPTSPKEKWISLAVDEFEIISSASASETMEIARELLRMRDAVGQVTRLNVRTSGRIKVFVFDERRFAPYRDAAFQRKMENTTGAYFSSDGGNFILLQNEFGRDIDRTVYHELTHHFARNTAASMPLWFNEGLAEFYSTFKTSAGDINIGRPVAEHVQWLRTETLIPLRELLATTTDSPIYNEGLRQGVFYAESWALVHYLLTGPPERRASLGKFLQSVEAGKAVDDAFASSFGITYAQLEKDLRAYVRQQAFTFTKYSLSGSASREMSAPVPMSRDALLYELGHLYTWTGNMEVAERFLAEALTVNRNHAGAHADLGYVYDRAGRRAEADASYARAVALGTEDARVHLQYGLALMNRLVEKKAGKVGESDLVDARAAFKRSTDLDPRSARAWAGLGATYIGASGDHAPGIAALEKSLALDPGDPHAAFYLLQLYADAGRAEDAARLMPVVARATDPRMTSIGRQALVLADVRKIEGLARQGHNTEAIALAESALSRANDPQLVQYLQSFLTELRTIETSKSVIASLNEAVTQANAGKIAEAVAILDEAIPKITDPKLLEEAKKMRAQMAARMKRK